MRPLLIETTASHLTRGKPPKKSTRVRGRLTSMYSHGAARQRCLDWIGFQALVKHFPVSRRKVKLPQRADKAPGITYEQIAWNTAIDECEAAIKAAGYDVEQ